MHLDPFATLGLTPSFDVDLKALEKTHRELSRALHPDRYASSGASERQAALSRALEVNEAFRIVRDPVRRAEALFARHDMATGDGKEPKASPAFLMDVMEQREALSEARAARDIEAVRALASSIDARREEAERELGEGFRRATEGESGDDAREVLGKLLGKLGELRYYRRFLDEASTLEDELDGP